MKAVMNEIMSKIEKYTAFLESIKLKEVEPEIDAFFYSIICNDGYVTDQMPLYKYESEVRKAFLTFFLKYVKLKFGEFYKNELENPFFEEIELQLISTEIDTPQNQEIQEEMMQAQFFAYTRQKYKKSPKVK